jgi:hypothetical protein
LTCYSLFAVRGTQPHHGKDEREAEKVERNEASDPVPLSFKELQRKKITDDDIMKPLPEAKGGILKEKSDMSFPT